MTGQQILLARFAFNPTNERTKHMEDKQQQYKVEPEKPEAYADTLLKATVDLLQRCKPNDRSDRDRRFAIVITEVEKVQAILRQFLLSE